MCQRKHTCIFNCLEVCVHPLLNACTCLLCGHVQCSKYGPNFADQLLTLGGHCQICSDILICTCMHVYTCMFVKQVCKLNQVEC